jgi:hypothetical protein
MNTEKRLSAIEERNRAVSLNKQWETSVTRRASVAAITYATAAFIFVFVIPQEKWYLSACVPAAGYLLSTLGLSRIRTVWERFQREGE